MALFLASVSVAYAQTTAPTVSTVAVTSDPGTDDTYALGDTIEVGLTFDEAVTVIGDPYLLIDVGGTNRQTGLQRRGNHRAARHHGLRSYRGDLHRRRQETVQLAELHRDRAGPVEQGGCAPAGGI